MQRPADALPGRGGVNVRMQAKLAGDLPGVRDFLRALSVHLLRAAGVDRDRPARPRALERADGALPDYLDRDGLVKFWPLMRDGDDTLTAYVLVDRRRGGLRDSRARARRGWSRR